MTHRVVRVVEMDGARWLEAQGDANATPDPALIPEDAVIGVVATRIAYLGYLLALVAMPSGIVSLIAFGAMLLLAVWVIEGAEASARDRHRRRRRRRTRIITGSHAHA